MATACPADDSREKGDAQVPVPVMNMMLILGMLAARKGARRSEGAENADGPAREREGLEEAFQLALADPSERDLLEGAPGRELAEKATELKAALALAARCVAITIPKASLGAATAAVMYLVARRMRRRELAKAAGAKPAPITSAERSALATHGMLLEGRILHKPRLRRALMKALGARRSQNSGELALKVAARTYGGRTAPNSGGTRTEKTHVIIGAVHSEEAGSGVAFRVRRFAYSPPTSKAKGGWREVSDESDLAHIDVHSALTAFFTDTGQATASGADRNASEDRAA